MAANSAITDAQRRLAEEARQAASSAARPGGGQKRPAGAVEIGGIDLPHPDLVAALSTALAFQLPALLPACIQNGLQNFDVPTRDDLTASIKTAVQPLESSIKDLTQDFSRMDERQKVLEQKIEDIQKVQQQDQHSSSPTRASSNRSLGSSQGSKAYEWIPRSVVLRGFAPFGCGDNDKISADEHRNLVEQITRHLPLQQQLRLKAAQPFLRNHQVELFGSPAGWESVREFSRIIEKIVVDNDIKARGYTLSVGQPSSPERRATIATSYKAKTALEHQGLATANIEMCHRSNQIYHKDATGNHLLLGKVDRNTKLWMWSDDHLRRINLDPETLRAAMAQH